MDNSSNDKANLGGRATRGLVVCCWESPCPHNGERRQAEVEFLRDFYPWSLDDAAWLTLMGMGFQ